jgi:hypothetical protein
MKSSSIALTTIFSILALLSSSFSIINKQIEQNLTSKVKRLVNFKIKDEINSIRLKNVAYYDEKQILKQLPINELKWYSNFINSNTKDIIPISICTHREEFNYLIYPREIKYIDPAYFPLQYANKEVKEDSFFNFDKYCPQWFKIYLAYAELMHYNDTFLRGVCGHLNCFYFANLMSNNLQGSSDLLIISTDDFILNNDRVLLFDQNHNRMKFESNFFSAFSYPYEYAKKNLKEIEILYLMKNVQKIDTMRFCFYPEFVYIDSERSSKIKLKRSY